MQAKYSKTISQYSKNFKIIKQKSVTITYYTK